MTENWKNHTDKLLSLPSPKLVKSIKNSKHISNKPKYFIIKYGPPSSGKGYLTSHIVNRLEISSYMNIEVDEYVKILANNNEPINQETYWKLRTEANLISDQLLMLSLYMHDNILWETTGNSIDWVTNLYIPLIKSFGYKVVLLMPIVAFEKMYKRCTTRNQAANCNQLKSIKTNSSSNFSTVASISDRVILYDNNIDNNSQLIFDYDVSSKKTTVCPKLNNNFYKESDIDAIKVYVKDACKNNSSSNSNKKKTISIKPLSK